MSLLLCIAMLGGCATPSQLRADQEVRDLCAAEGGVHVYESVRGNSADSVEQVLGGGAYVRKDRVQILSGNWRAGLRVLKEVVQVVRISDNKVLGEMTFFVRIGGNVIEGFSPTSLRCPEYAGMAPLIRAIFTAEVQQ